MDWATFLRAVPVVATAVGSVAAAILKIRHSRRASKARLESDLAILDKLENGDDRDRVAAYVSKQIEVLYAPGHEPSQSVRSFFGGVNWGMLIAGFVFGVGFGIWTAYLVRDGFTLWALLTGFWAVAGVGWIVTAFGVPYGTMPGGQEASAPADTRSPISSSQD